MNDILTITAGVLLAFFVLRLVDWIMAAPARAAHKRHQEKMREAMEEMAADLVKHLEEAEVKKPKRRKPVTKKKGTK